MSDSSTGELPPEVIGIARPPSRPGPLILAKPERSGTDALLAMMIWFPIFGWTVLQLGSMFVTCHRDGILVVEQTASAAMTAVYVLAGYIFGKGADSIIRGR